MTLRALLNDPCRSQIRSGGRAGAGAAGMKIIVESTFSSPNDHPVCFSIFPLPLLLLRSFLRTRNARLVSPMIP